MNGIKSRWYKLRTLGTNSITQYFDVPTIHFIYLQYFVWFRIHLMAIVQDMQCRRTAKRIFTVFHISLKKEPPLLRNQRTKTLATAKEVKIVGNMSKYFQNCSKLLLWIPCALWHSKYNELKRNRSFDGNNNRTTYQKVWRTNRMLQNVFTSYINLYRRD